MSALERLGDALLGNDGRHEADVPRPEPVLDEARAKAKVAAVVTALATAAVALGVSATDAAALAGALIAIGGGLVVVVNYVLTMRAAYAARARVTPVEDPWGADGPLRPPA